ncbi:type II toxin-antitoxin system death-on-curing family toxin [Oceanicoccus sagamiensis]|uniref:type II toxin-antitoxin system death-on-curing family toxin n=1 Tax=Oceanicoccus sagamiensis TaxID=716816 RepID=UPI000A266F9A|nr:type II toxin-antitoxin system death-on-curing family toxin [Oceanicoccus sagamiensis]
MASQRSIDAIITRIDNRIDFGMIEDVFELAACYACYIAFGHAFNDANKRTAFATMDICLAVNGITLTYDTREAGDLMIQAAQSVVDEKELASWLRTSFS